MNTQSDFKVGDSVKHKEFNFTGVIQSLQTEPIYSSDCFGFCHKYEYDDLTAHLKLDADFLGKDEIKAWVGNLEHNTNLQEHKMNTYEKLKQYGNQKLGVTPQKLEPICNKEAEHVISMWFIGISCLIILGLTFVS